MAYPSRKRPLRSDETYQAPVPEWVRLDLEQWLEKNVTDRRIWEWYQDALQREKVRAMSSVALIGRPKS